MTGKTLLAIPLVLAAAIGAATAGDPLAIGAPMPSTGVKMTNVDGKDVSLSQVAKPAGTLVVFTCNHCPFAKAWESRIVALGNDYAAKGIGVVAINSNDPAVAPEDGMDTMQQRAKEAGMKFPYVVDATSSVAKAFGATRTPEAFLFDKNGKLVYHGAVDDNKEDPKAVTNPYLKNALDAVVAGTDVAVKETKSIGCGIKFRS
jgi:peroxiredoxin